MERKKLSSLLICMGVLLMLFGCKSDGQKGGRTDKTDLNASKKIDSKEIKEFDSSFYIIDRYEPELDGRWYIRIKKDGDKCLLSEKRHFDTEVTLDADILVGLQEIIDKHDLVLKNGVNDTTAGLPEEYRDCDMYILYESGEKLYFNIDGDPESEWANDIAHYIRQVLIDAGHEEFKAPEKTVTHYSFYFRMDDTHYHYSFIYDGNGELKILRWYGKDGHNENSIKDIPEDYNAFLMAIIDDLELKRFHEGSLFNGDSEEFCKGEYYEIYIDFEDGTQIYGYANDGKKLQQFEMIKDELFERLDSCF